MIGVGLLTEGGAEMPRPWQPKQNWFWQEELDLIHFHVQGMDFKVSEVNVTF